MPYWIPWLFVAVLLAGPVSPRTALAADACAVSVAFTTPDTPLAQLAAALRAGGPVNILAVGSATTVGDQLGTDRHTAFPYRMVEALHAALPNVAFGLTLRGGRGMTAVDMEPMLAAALETGHYALVLWQTGTVEAVRGQDPDQLLGALQEGVEHARDAGADVVLIDPQFSRFLRANTNLDPYRTAMEQAAVMPGVVLFHRYDMMQDLAEAGDIDLERAPRAARVREMTLLNDCLGSTLARFLLTGAEVPTQ